MATSCEQQSSWQQHSFVGSAAVQARASRATPPKVKQAATLETKAKARLAAAAAAVARSGSNNEASRGDTLSRRCRDVRGGECLAERGDMPAPFKTFSTSGCPSVVGVHAPEVLDDMRRFSLIQAYDVEACSRNRKPI